VEGGLIAVAKWRVNLDRNFTHMYRQVLIGFWFYKYSFRIPCPSLFPRAAAQDQAASRRRRKRRRPAATDASPAPSRRPPLPAACSPVLCSPAGPPCLSLFLRFRRLPAHGLQICISAADSIPPGAKEQVARPAVRAAPTTRRAAAARQSREHRGQAFMRSIQLFSPARWPSARGVLGVYGDPRRFPANIEATATSPGMIILFAGRTSALSATAV